VDNAAYYVAGIDVHKKMLAVVVANARNRELQFEYRRFGTTVSELQKLSTWLQEHAVQEVVGTHCAILETSVVRSGRIGHGQAARHMG
jgi:hypothetical protein